ncbi:MAG: 16S rRNA (cytidine(1402)-2'-O)-methyltransferase, partial [Clostridiales bacterium]|nr:16S rRNA (cytidine(1402)-2'-O)-methyltransferase [Clostridiales bacterium]
MLYLVGTPIGNLSDMSPRAEEVLAQADVIACEDTRVTGILLKEKGIEAKKLFCYQEHNKAAKGP